VPAYNEFERISETVCSLKRFLPNLNEVGIEGLVYVIDDGSADNTRQLAKEAGADRVLRHRVNRGLGAAVRTGLAAARNDEADIVIKFDADLQHNPEDIKRLIEPILNDEADVVYGNRFEKISYKMPFVRRIGNIVFTGLMRWLTKWPLRDSQPGIFAVNLAYLKVFRLPGDYNYTQQILLDAYHKGMRFAHCSVSFDKRTTGKSFVSFKYPAKVLPQILMVIAGVKPMKIFAPIGLSFLLFASCIFGIEIIYWLLGMTTKPVMHVNAVLGLSMFGLQSIFFGVIAELINLNTKN
jgi:glycosyltransferase involved in cell wall biosynthesis